MIRWLVSIADGLSALRDFPPLFFRWVLAYGFLYPFLTKFYDLAGFAEFLDGLQYPFPSVSAYVAMVVEGVGVVLLFFGLATRIWTIPLMCMMGIAIGTVHWEQGFSAIEGGFEIPLYYLVMLFSLFITGPGRISIDAWIARGARKSRA